MMSEINPKDTKAILIGVSEYQDKANFVSAAPIKNNVPKIKALLQDPLILGLPDENILVYTQNERHDEILDGIESFLDKEFTDTVIFYFAGHGYKTKNGDFYMVTNNSRAKRIKYTSLPWSEIKNILQKGNGIQQRFYLLDACHSGAATLSADDNVLEIEKGSALIAAASEDEKAYFDKNNTFTDFSNAFIQTLENGADNIELEAFDANYIHDNINKILKQTDNCFDTQIKKNDKIDNVTFFKNKKYDPSRKIEKEADILFEQGNYKDAIILYYKAKDLISSKYLMQQINKCSEYIEVIAKQKSNQIINPVQSYNEFIQRNNNNEDIKTGYPKTDKDIIWQDDKHGVFTDPRDGQKYKVVKIGNQIWLAENLNFTQGIPHITDDKKWWNLENNNIDQAWCYYDNKNENGKTYGALYTYAAALRAAPPGWHLPTIQEFETLLNNYGGEGEKAYKALIKSGKSDFNILFGGCRDFYGSFDVESYHPCFWSATEEDDSVAWGCFLYSSDETVFMGINNESVGFSVRLLRD